MALSRSLAKAGPRGVTNVRAQSETTLRIASLHFEVGAFTGAASDAFEPPSGTSDARNR